MANGMSDEIKELLSSFRVEYSNIEQRIRFLQSARIALGVFGGTLFSALFSAYLALSPQDGKFVEMTFFGLTFIPLIGIASLAAILLVEHRLHTMHVVCMRRGETVESELGITEGIYKQMRALPRPFGVATSGIGAYVAIALAAGIWLFLLIATLLSQ